MKKLISLFAAAAMLSTVAVQAAELKNYMPTDNKYSIEYEGLTVGAYYGMVAVKGDGLTVLDMSNTENVTYIDQATANNEGTISFSDFAPKGLAASDDKYVESTVFIGGEGLDGAQAIGILRKDGYKAEIIISGSVVDTFAANKEAKIIVQNETGTVKEIKANADGTYSIAVDPAASYTVVLTKDGFLKFTITGVPAEADIALGAVTITDLSGDVDGNNEVALADLNAVLGNYNEPASNLAEEDKNADIDGNGEVALADLNAVLGHYNDGSITQAYVAPAE